MKNLRVTHSTNRLQDTPESKPATSRFKHCEEKEIWDSFRAGSQDALIFIYNRYFSQLIDYGLQFTSDRDFIKDCIQDLFVDLTKQGRRLGATTSIKFYLYRSLRRRLHKQGIKKVLLWESYPDGLDFHPADNKENALIKDEQEKMMLFHLQKSITQLSKRQREAVYYYFYEDFSYQEIADLMGMSKIKSARTLLYRAIDRLKEQLGEGGPLSPWLVVQGLLFLLYATI